MRNGVNIRDLNGVEASTSQFPLIGYTVFWRLAGIRVSHPDLERALQATSFDKYLPDPPTPRVALRRALAEWIRAKQRIARNWQLQMICTTDAEGVIDAQRESQQVTDELMPYWRKYRDLFIARDLSEMMREIIDGMNAVSLRQAGGVYFVPANERDSLLRLRQLIDDIPQVTGLDPFVCALGVPDAVEAKRGLSKAVHAGLLDEVNSLRGDLGRSSKSGDRLGEKTIAQRLVIYKRLKAKAEMYQDMLGIQQDQVRAGIAELDREALNLISADDIPLSSSTSHTPATLFSQPELEAV